MKNPVDRITSSLDSIREKISELESITLLIIQTEAQRPESIIYCLQEMTLNKISKRLKMKKWK